MSTSQCPLTNRQIGQRKRREKERAARVGNEQVSLETCSVCVCLTTILQPCSLLERSLSQAQVSQRKRRQRERDARLIHSPSVVHVDTDVQPSSLRTPPSSSTHRTSLSHCSFRCTAHAYADTAHRTARRCAVHIGLERRRNLSPSCLY
jgi:hypothetical protein